MCVFSAVIKPASGNIISGGGVMELSEMTRKISDIFEVTDVNDIGNKIFETLLEDDVERILAVKNILPDLKTDWLQTIYQY